ncbi:MAG: type II toxin-antitoxin system ParD family antitoxin [Brevundimonas sp.]|jgi:antitoxin ParD1/3/4|uniref:type II toxin-antitoxin system ParD family antitoxin n=1 Tax=Brevundimonas sp. TaxID=1871086 RepID=UPI00181E7DC4|nr:type II toxin-antitoxin system ParD family antitoxin [Brevundimonas sp.]MBA4804565.1 type II toxin-antitoxin system ParD family antitoxin [Brevundimonas sp.]
MAEITVSLPEDLNAWVEAQVRAGRYRDAGEVVRDLLRREQVRAGKIAHLERLVDEARASGVSERSVDEIFAEARAEALTQTTHPAAG